MPPKPEPMEQRYLEVRAASEALAAPLSPEDCALQSMPDASPVKWHLAHTSWFFETLVLEGTPGYRPFHPQFRTLFNSYYQSLGDPYPRPQRGLLSRPALAEVMAYRRDVDARVVALLERGADAALRQVVELGLHHEQQHQELLLTDVKHLFSLNPLRPAYRPGAPEIAADPGPLAWHAYAQGLRWQGSGDEGFAFDNERPRHRVFAPAFELASRPVANAEYMAFVGDGGYARPELWLSDGFAAVQREGWRAPLYWEEHDGGWQILTLAGPRALRPEEPVCHLSYFEAEAFARWSGARLPTEAEWECAASDLPVEGNFAESSCLHPQPAPKSAHGPGQLFGDIWEWTASAYAPYPGFRPLAGSLGEYNGKFMSGQMVLRGGSCASPRSHLRASYRNFFYPTARWQFSGLRLARDCA